MSRAITNSSSDIWKHVRPILRYLNGLKQPTEYKDAQELQEIKEHAKTLTAAAGAEVACWFKDSNGTDLCFPYTAAECKARGGTAVPGDCPNFFAAVKAARNLAKLDPKKRGSAKRNTVKKAKKRK